MLRVFQNGRLCIVKGVDINSNESGPTPLNISIITGRAEIVQLLLKNSADANTRNTDTETPLDLAYEWKRKNCRPPPQTRRQDG